MKNYVILLNSKKLGSFVANDLPYNGKMFEAKKYKDNHMFMTYNDMYKRFGTEEEAQAHVDMIKESIDRNKERYEECFKGSYKKLMDKANKLRIVIDDGLFN